MEWIIFLVFVLIFSISSITLLLKVNDNFKIEVPARGGTLSEGIIGSPRFVNPVLAISDSDKDISSLIYSGLMKVSSSGDLENDLAKSYTISDDGTVYTFDIKENAVFHDGTPITSDDIIFTIQKILDPSIKSLKRANWEGITVEKIDERTIKFILKNSYSGFLEIATVGILPKHIWEKIDSNSFPFSNYNVVSIGSGPYKVSKVNSDSSGIITSYNLKSFDKYIKGRPYIDNFNILFYQNEDDLLNALDSGNIDNIAGISSEKATSSALLNSNITLNKTSLARSFGIFFNQSYSPVLRIPEVRKALALAVNREDIIKNAVNGFGEPLYGPIPNISSNNLDLNISPDDSKIPNTALAIALLEKNGWTKGVDGIYQKKIATANKTSSAKKADTTGDVIKLEFSISTSNSPELKKTAEILRDEWKGIGANVTVKIFESGDLTQNIIATRKYDSLLFGEVIGRDLDLYSFWHSSQIKPSGLNVAMYTNTDVDKILERIRISNDKDARQKDIQKLAEYLQKDLPAIFLFSPTYAYALSKDVKGSVIKYTARPSDRWNNISEWYVLTDKIWKFLK
ncbi:MAG: peptide ABC transporter substrate-binding protein [bacterium]|nr:peptide ABC transporter substrate-binding protein [bacterium]